MVVQTVKELQYGRLVHIQILTVKKRSSAPYLLRAACSLFANFQLPLALAAFIFWCHRFKGARCHRIEVSFNHMTHTKPAASLYP